MLLHSIRPRIQKVAYAADWREGKPVAGSAGQSHMFHYFWLESYEDTLNNLRFRSLDGPLFEALDAMPDYLLHYMLDYETAAAPACWMCRSSRGHSRTSSTLPVTT